MYKFKGEALIQAIYPHKRCQNIAQNSFCLNNSMDCKSLINCKLHNGLLHHESNLTFMPTTSDVFQPLWYSQQHFSAVPAEFMLKLKSKHVHIIAFRRERNCSCEIFAQIYGKPFIFDFNEEILFVFLLTFACNYTPEKCQIKQTFYRELPTMKLFIQRGSL